MAVPRAVVPSYNWNVGVLNRVEFVMLWNTETVTEVIVKSASFATAGVLV